jgi:hypothetical protein
MPGAACFYTVLDLFELFDKAVIATVANQKGKLVVFAEQLHVFLAAGSDHVVDCSRQVIGNILGEHGDSYVTASNKLSRIWDNVTDEELHKGRFTGTVPAQKADPLADLDLERNTIQQPWFAEAY